MFSGCPSVCACVCKCVRAQEKAFSDWLAVDLQFLTAYTHLRLEIPPITPLKIN